MLLEDERYVIKWLSQYGALPKTQIIRMLQKPQSTAEKILKNLKRELMISEIKGYYIGLDTMCQPDQRTILAIWVLLKFIDQINPMAHYPAAYPSKLFFLKDNTGYEIVVLYDGENNLLKLLQPEEDLKYIIVVPSLAVAKQLKLPKARCLLAIVEFQGKEEPEVIFYDERR